MLNGVKNCGVTWWSFVCRKWTEVLIRCEDNTEHQWHHILSITNNTWIWPLCQCNRQGRYLVPESYDRYAKERLILQVITWRTSEHLFSNFSFLSALHSQRSSSECKDLLSIYWQNWPQAKFGHIISLTGAMAPLAAVMNIMILSAEPIMELFFVHFCYKPL